MSMARPYRKNRKIVIYDDVIALIIVTSMLEELCNDRICGYHTRSRQWLSYGEYIGYHMRDMKLSYGEYMWSLCRNIVVIMR